MAGHLYEQYEGQYLQQAELCEESAVACVRAAFGGFSRGYLQILRSLAMPHQPSSQASGTINVNLLTAAQEEINAARDLAQRQLATALANGLGAIANLPFSANEPTVSETSTNQVNAEKEADNSDNDLVPIKSEVLSECECESDCESVHSVEIEINEEIENQTKMDTTAGPSIANSKLDNVSVNREIKSARSNLVSNDEVEFTGNSTDEATDEAMRHSECEQVNMEDEQTRDLSGIINFVAISPRSLVPYELSDEEEDNERENNSVDSFDLFNSHLPSINDTAHSMTASTSTGRYEQSRNKVNVNYAEPTEELSVDTDNLAMTVNSNGKRTTRRPRKLSTPKRVHVEPVVAAVKEESVSLSVIVHHLKCPVTGCKKKCNDKAQLDGHLWVKHKIKMYQCKVRGCNQSFAKKTEMTDHRKSAHHKLKNWPCDKCETTRKSYSELTSHFGKCHQKGLFQCSADKCDFTGKTRQRVRHHQRQHSTVKYECTFAHCMASFKRKSHLTRHQRSHNQVRPFACEECPKTFTAKWELNNHEKIHSGLKPYHCKWPGCDHSANVRSNVTVHVRTVHFGLPRTKKEQIKRRIIDTRDAREFVEEVEFTSNATDESMRHSECEQVNMEDGPTQDLSGIINFVGIRLSAAGQPLVHYELSNEEDGNERENDAVDLFDDHWPSINDAAHSMTASTSTGRYRQSRSRVKENYAEPTEELPVAMAGQRKREVPPSGTAKTGGQPHAEAPSTARATVPGEPLKVITKRLSCPQADCNKVRKDKKKLDVHLKAKHAIEEYRCLVSKCKRSFKYRSQLRDHLRHGHGKRSNWPCGLCSSSFVSHELLHKHHYMLHEEGLFECSVDDCGFKGTTRRKVYKHHETHRTPKHICSVDNCGRSFPRKCDLKKHTRLHTKERPYACEGCGKSFARKGVLTAHSRVHRGLMTTRCTWPDCTFQAISPSNVVMHIRTVHYKLPRTLTKQAQLGIIDTRNPYDFLEKI